MINPRSRRKSDTWWGGRGCPPAAWIAAFDDFTRGASGREWGLAASLFVMHHHRKHAEGPTFREVFEHLLPETSGAPSLLAGWEPSERLRTVHRFRYFVLSKWSQRGFVEFDKGVSRSLRTGPQFREITIRERHIQDLVRKKPPRSGRGPSDAVAAATLAPEGAAARLRITETALRRLTKAGYLRRVTHEGQALYPSWQFSSQPNKPVVAGIEVVAPAIPEHWPLAAEHYFMAAPRMELAVDGRHRSPSDWLDLGMNPHIVAGILEKYSYDIGR